MREKKSLKKSLLTGVAMGCKENFADQCRTGLYVVGL